MAILRISGLRLRTVVGIFQWEQNISQEVIADIEITYDASQAIKTDHIDEALDYKALSKEIIQTVESSKFFLLERLTDEVLKIVMAHDKVQEATVRIDKPGALRFARSVSAELSAKR